MLGVSGVIQAGHCLNATTSKSNETAVFVINQYNLKPNGALTDILANEMRKMGYGDMSEVLAENGTCECGREYKLQADEIDRKKRAHGWEALRRGNNAFMLQCNKDGERVAMEHGGDDGQDKVTKINTTIYKSHGDVPEATSKFHIALLKKPMDVVKSCQWFHKKGGNGSEVTFNAIDQHSNYHAEILPE